VKACEHSGGAGGEGGDCAALVELSEGGLVLLVLRVGAGEENVEDLGESVGFDRGNGF